MPGEAALLLRNEATGQKWRVWPDPESVEPGAVQENRSYLFELYGCAGAAGADLLIDDVPLEALRAPGPDSGRWRWSPGFHAGTAEAELRVPGEKARRFEIITDPDRRKLTRDDFDTMLREILEDTFALFSLGGLRRAVARGAGKRAPAIARLEFLRSRIEELETSVAEVGRRPRHMLAATETVIPYYRAGGATGPEILRSFRSGRVLRERPGLSRLPPAMQGFLPEHICVRRRVHSMDLPEHRQMAACLRAWAEWLSVAAGILERSGSSEIESRQSVRVWTERCHRLSRRISSLTQYAIFAEAGGAAPRLTLSPLFRNDPLYRRFYRVWQDMNLGIAAVFGDFLNLPLARTFELYELWCFLRLVRAAVEEFGPEGVDLQDLFFRDAAGGVTLATGAVTVAVGSGWKLCFQKQYREFWNEPDRRGSFSRPVVPDVAVIQETGEGVPKLIVLDAKYRIEQGLSDALTSVHTYRDALVREVDTGMPEGIVSAAYLLAPYVPALAEGYRETQMPARLFHPEYRTDFCFGAVTLRPGMTSAEIAEALRLIISDVTGNSH